MLIRYLDPYIQNLLRTSKMNRSPGWPFMKRRNQPGAHCSDGSRRRHRGHNIGASQIAYTIFVGSLG